MAANPEYPDAQERLAVHLQRTPLAAIDFDRKGRIVSWNPAAERIFGWTFDEVKGRRFDLLAADGQMAAFEAWWETIPSRFSGDTSELPCVAKGGQLVDCDWHSTPLVDDQKRVFGVASLVADVTRRRQAVREQIADLEQRLAECTGERDAAVQELESFSTTVSQDLMAPLRAIDGFSQALAEECRSALPTQGVRHLQRIRSATKRMGDLINALMNLSRVARQGLKTRKVDLSELAQQAIDNLQQTDPTRKVSVHIQPGLTAHADRELLKILMQNLLDNAWKYTQRTPDPRIVVGAVDCPSGRTYFVRDNGVGFDPVAAGKLFQPFQKLHRAEDFEGHGIGLATVLRIVRKHGGQVRLEGRPHGGATGWFTLGCGLASEQELSSHEMPVFAG
jgi:PAS domain S-box-containing protein